ncbi:terpenoid synthase [Trametes sanguinea]|nr:terpenoid synthase [Trametes sanguinea]
MAVIVKPVPATPEQSVQTDQTLEVQEIMRDFLARVGYSNSTPWALPNASLRAELTAEVLSWNAGLSMQAVDSIVDTACTIAESGYSYMPPKHQRLAAYFTAYMVYVDDLGHRDLEALGHAIGRFVSRQPLEDPVLERLTRQFQDMYEYFPRLGADSINASTMEALVGMYTEFSQKDAIAPGAILFPGYLRVQTGVARSYAHFNFAKGWRDPADTFYLQLIPPLVHFINAVNDILSFYKEILIGETDNYIHQRAAAEQKEPLAVLRELVDETLDHIDTAAKLTASDPELGALFRGHLMGYIEFHFRAKRYHLDDLQL